MQAFKKIIRLSTTLLIFTLFLINNGKAQQTLDNAGIQKQLAKYNPVWTEQSKNSSESMPLSGSKGNGLNVWVQDGDIYCYLANNECYDEDADLAES